MCYIVIDLEMCKVPKVNRTESYKWGREIIQIGAVMLNSKYEIIDEFMTYVSPEIGILDYSIERLTGIKNHNLKDAPNTEKAFELFAEWLPENSILVAWSENDEAQIKHEILAKKINFVGINKLTDNWIDCQINFSKIMNKRKRYSLEEALNLSNVIYDSNMHNGLVDAKNTALLFKKMETEKEFQFNTYYLNMKQDTGSLTSSLGSLFPGLNMLKLA